MKRLLIGQARVAGLLRTLRSEAANRLDNAADALSLRRPDEWDDDAIEWLAQALLQAKVIEGTYGGSPERMVESSNRYPLTQAFEALVPTKSSEMKRALCEWLMPVAAPPTVAVAVGSSESTVLQITHTKVTADETGVWSGVSTGGTTPYWPIATLAARRAACGRAKVFKHSMVYGEAGPASGDTASTAQLAARMGGLPFFVVIGLANLAPGERIEDHTGRVTAGLSDARVIVVVDNVDAAEAAASQAVGDSVVVSINEADADFVLLAANYLHQQAFGKPWDFS